MFWRVSGLNTASPVDSILDKENYTLEELLDEDELIQECKSLNARLTAFLKQKETVEKLLRYLVEPAPPSSDPKRHFKYPFAACEIFCCEVEGIFNTLLENDELLDRLFSLLAAPRPLNSMLAGYFSRVMGSLLLRRTHDVAQYLQRRRELLRGLVDHVDTTSVAEVLVRLVGADEQRGFLPTNHLQWLSDTDLLYLLLDKLQPGEPVDAQSNASEILAAIAQSQVSPLARNLAEPAFLEQLVDRALQQPAAAAAAAAAGSAAAAAAGAKGSGEAAAAAAGGKEGGVGAAAATPAAAAPPTHIGHSSAMTHALNVCISLLDPMPPPPEQPQGHPLSQPMEPSAAEGAALEAQAQLRRHAVQCVARSVGRLVSLLEAVDPQREVACSFGLLKPPVGQTRLKAVELLAVLLRTGDPAAEAAVMGTDGVQRCQALFLAHPFNNVLHRNVTTLLTAFDGGSPPLLDFLFTDCGLLGWLVGAPEEVTPLPRPGDPFLDKRRPMRAGYCGHLTQIANLLRRVGEAHPKVRELLAADPAWQTYVAGRLEACNARENVYAWQCGRPTAHEPTMEAEGDVFQTELDFGPIDSEAFSRDVYQRYGVFDGDEEEEAEQPQWSLDLTSGAAAAAGAGVGAAAGAAAALGKLPQRDVPASWEAAFDESSSSSSGSEEEEAAPMAESESSAQSDEGGAASVAPAPDGSGSGANGKALAAGAASAGASSADDMADMLDDAVLLEYEAAEQLVELQRQVEQQLTLEDTCEACEASGGLAPAAAAGEEEQREPGPAPPAAAQSAKAAAAALRPAAAHPAAANGPVDMAAGAAGSGAPQMAAAAGEEGVGDEPSPDFNSFNYWKSVPPMALEGED